MPTPPPEDDDDLELELEPVDPEILEIERQRAQRKTDAVVTKATFEELQQQRPGSHDDYDIDLSKLRQFRFTTRHLFIVTAILAIGLTLRELVGGCMAVFIMALTGIGAGWFVIYRNERRQALELAKERERFLGQQRTGAATAAGPLADEIDDASPAITPEADSQFRFAFSLKQMLIVMTASAVFLGVLNLIDVKALTITLGVIAVVGLAVQTFGWFDPPPAVVWGWWVLLMMYLSLGLLTAFFPDLMGASLSPGTLSRGAAYALC